MHESYPMLLIPLKSGKFVRSTCKKLKNFYQLKTLPALFSLLLIMACLPASAQSKGGNVVSLGINIPFGDFSQTHFIGIAADYSPTRHRFGLIKLKKFALTWSGGAAYYFGKRSDVINDSYHYRSFIFIHGFGGILYKLNKQTNFILYAGPGAGIYHGNLRFIIGSRLEMNYMINQKFGIAPGILLMKEHGADALWAASLKGILYF